MPQNSATELSPHYYRDNFLRLCATVNSLYGEMLDREEADFLASFESLGFDAQCLYVRLISRRGPWFRTGKLSYPEIGDIDSALQELIAAKLLLVADELDIEEIGALFTRAELLLAFGSEFPGNPGSKQALLEAMVALALTPGELREKLAAVDATAVVAPGQVAVVERLQILFFGNRHQGLTEFVLQDLGVARYFPYPLERSQRLFAEREAFDEFLRCAALHDLYIECCDNGDVAGLTDLATEVAGTGIEYASSTSRFDRLCNNLARDLERIEEWELAAALYRRSGRHPARERYCRILEKRGEWLAARRLCEEIIDQPWCAEEQEAAQRILPRLLRQLGEKPAPRRRDSFTRRTLVLERDEQPVELLAANHLQAEWPRVHYVENSLINTLFGLAFWEQIFLPLPGAFHHPFQAVPADMYDGNFLPRRRQSIEQRLQELTADLPGSIDTALTAYHGYQCHWTDWRHIDAELVTTTVHYIPAAHLLAIWRQQLFDPREHRRGFPDLVAFGEQPGDYQLIEVKGPGDTLQDNQRRWLRFFDRQGIPASVAHVEWRSD